MREVRESDLASGGGILRNASKKISHLPDGEKPQGKGGKMSVVEFFIAFPVYPKNKKVAYRRGIITDDARTKDNAISLVSLFWPHRPERPIEGPVTVSYRFQTAWRKPDAKKRAKGLLPAFLPQVTGSDLGNRTKQADDVLKKAKFIVDDKQIWSYGGTCKVWADVTGVAVRIEAEENG